MIEVKPAARGCLIRHHPAVREHEGAAATDKEAAPAVSPAIADGHAGDRDRATGLHLEHSVCGRAHDSSGQDRGEPRTGADDLDRPHDIEVTGLFGIVARTFGKEGVIPAWHQHAVDAWTARRTSAYLFIQIARPQRRAQRAVRARQGVDSRGDVDLRGAKRRAQQKR